MTTGYPALGLRALGRNIGLNLVRQGVVIALGFALSILLARSLGPAGNGRYAVALLLPTMLATLLNLGIAPANVYFVGRGEVSVGQALRTSLISWALLTTAGVGVGVYVIRFRSGVWFPGVSVAYLWLAMVIFPVTMLRDFLSSLLQAVQDFVHYNKMMVTPSAVALVSACVTVVGLGWGVPGALLATVCGSLTGLAVGFAVLKSYPSTTGAATEPYGRKCLTYGWKAHLSNILAFLNYRADIFLLNVLIAPAAVGVYVVAVQIAERLWVLSAAVSTALLPRLSALHSEEEVRRKLTPLISRWVLMVSLVGSIILSMVVAPLVRLFFGLPYMEAATALRWLLPGIAVGSASRVLTNDIAARGRPELNMYTASAVVSINVIANLLLIPRMGMVGAAIATTISYSVNAVLKLMLYSRLSGNRWSRAIVIPRSDLVLAKRAVASIARSG